MYLLKKRQVWHLHKQSYADFAYITEEVEWVNIRQVVKDLVHRLTMWCVERRLGRSYIEKLIVNQ